MKRHMLLDVPFSCWEICPFCFLAGLMKLSQALGAQEDAENWESGVSERERRKEKWLKHKKKKVNVPILLHIFAQSSKTQAKLGEVGIVGCVKLPNSHERNLIWIGFINRISPPSQMGKEGRG